MIKKTDLQHGAYYAGECRNATIARWNGERQVFVYWRYKFGETLAEEVQHPDDHSP